MGEQHPKPIELGFTKAEIEESIRKNGSIISAWLDSVSSGTPTSEQDHQEMEQRVDALVELMGIDLANWQQHLTKATNETESMINPDVLHPDVTPGGLLFNLCYYSMDIESSEDGYGGGELEFRTPDGYVLSIRASGDFWTDRTYHNPLTDETYHSGDFLPGSHMDEVAMGSNEDFVVTSETHYTMSTEYFIDKPKTT